MGDFFSSLFGGQNKTLNSDINQSGSLAGYSTGVGEGDTTAASKFYQSILSGDPTQQATAIAPEAKALQDQTQQSKEQTAQFGKRSGGTGAATTAADSDMRAKLLSLLGGLKTSAASGASSLGTANLGLASQNTAQQANEAQQRFENWMNSILGKGTSTAVGAAEGAAMGG
jgi:hypothetical protein